MSSYFNVDSDQAIERLVGAWPDAPVEQLEVLDMILFTARQQVETYAPADPDVANDWDYYGGASTPVDDIDFAPWGGDSTRYAYAQLQQAINLWNAGRASSEGNVGDGAFSFTPRPLDKTIKQIIRPQRGAPVVY